MPNKELSPREVEIVELSMEGLTNEAIAHRLGLGVGTVNTYWLRIRLKVGGAGRTDTVAMIVRDRAEQTLRVANAERAGIEAVVRAGIGILIHEREVEMFEHCATLGLLALVVEQIRISFWATDNDLRIQITSNEGRSAATLGPVIAIGQTIYDAFGSDDPAHPVVACHLNALKGKESTVTLRGEYDNRILRVVPMLDEEGDILGCVSVLSLVSPQHAGAPDVTEDI